MTECRFTPEMAAAGREIYNRWAENPRASVDDLVSELYRRMRAIEERELWQFMSKS